MLHIPISEESLLEQIEAHRPGWLDRAAERRRSARALGYHDAEKTPVWSEIKSVYLRLQHDKCAFCERKLESETYGLVEHDLEHYRPKSEVRAWPTPEIRTRRKIAYEFATGGDAVRGYHVLAHAPLNYVTACKTCNTALKGSYFPVAGSRSRSTSEDVRMYAGERPLLIYPLGDVDERPEDLISFIGLFPVPRYRSGPRRRRAVVTIDFFELDTREHLLFGRAEQISRIYLSWEVLRVRPDDPNARKLLAASLSPVSAHTTCGRAFNALCTSDPETATRFYEEAASYLESATRG